MKTEKSKKPISRKLILEELSKIKVSDIMIPRSKVVLIDKNNNFMDIVETVINDGHSRFPVFSEKIDNIVGFLYAKDLLQFFRKIEVDFDITKILRKPLFVPENKKANELLALFRKEHVHIAIVVDEYGTMVGIISLEDILEEIVGDISDEYDREKKQSYRSIGKNEYILHPGMLLEEFNKIFKTEITSINYETIGGFILERFGYVPQQGESFKLDNLYFEIKKVEGSRIKEILLKKT